MRLSSTSTGDAYCPVCALDGIIMELFNPPDSLAITCGIHKFDTLALSKLAGTYGLEA